MELTRWLPTCRMRPVFFCASMTRRPSSIFWTIGFSHIDIFARVHGVDGDLRVPVVGGADDHGVDVRAREHFAVVAAGEYLISPALFRARQPAFVDVRGGYDLDAILGERGDGVFGAHAARADQRNLDPVVRRLGADLRCERRRDPGYSGANDEVTSGRGHTLLLLKRQKPAEVGRLLSYSKLKCEVTSSQSLEVDGRSGRAGRVREELDDESEVLDDCFDSVSELPIHS